MLEAAKRMNMSYMRAWLLVKSMNGCFRKPLVIRTRGGRRGGGTKLTATGQRLLALYRQLEKKGLEATKQTQKELIALLGK